VPYRERFDTDDGEFIFLEELEVMHPLEEGYLHLITSKSPKSLNSQFHREKNLHINASHGFSEGDLVEVSSEHGSVALHVTIDENLRDDCVLIYSGTEGVNKLTSSKHSYEGKNAIYQDVLVQIKLL